MSAQTPAVVRHTPEVLLTYAREVAASSVIPDDLRGNPGAVLSIMLYGESLGLHPAAALQAVYSVKGRPALKATTIRALLKAAGHKVVRKVYTNVESQIQIIDGHTGDTHELTWTIDDAVQDGAVTVTRDGEIKPVKGRSLAWKTRTRSMLYYRNLTELARLEYPELFLAAPYTPDELLDAEPAEIVEVIDITTSADAGDAAGSVHLALQSVLLALPADRLVKVPDGLTRLYGVQTVGDLDDEQAADLLRRLEAGENGNGHEKPVGVRVPGTVVNPDAETESVESELLTDTTEPDAEYQRVSDELIAEAVEIETQQTTIPDPGAGTEPPPGTHVHEMPEALAAVVDRAKNRHGLFDDNEGQ